MVKQNVLYNRGGEKAEGGGSDIPSVKATKTRGGANSEDDDTNSGVRSEEPVSNKEITSVTAPATDQETNAEGDEAVRENSAKLVQHSSDLGGVISAVKIDNLEQQEEGHPDGESLALATQGRRSGSIVCNLRSIRPAPRTSPARIGRHQESSCCVDSTQLPRNFYTPLLHYVFRSHNNHTAEQQQHAVVLKDGRVMAPTFRVGEVRCHDITTTSVRITWPKPADRKYPVYGYRVCTAEVGSRGFEVRPQAYICCMMEFRLPSSCRAPSLMM